MPRARPLDPRSQRQLANLRAQFLYREQQVLLVSSRVKLMETLIQQQQQLTSVYSLSHYHTQVEEGSRKLDLQWEAHTARLKRAVH